MGRFRFAGLMLALTMLLTGCVKSDPVQRQFFAMDTFMTFTAYGNGAEDGLAAGEEFLHRLESEISVTREGSDLAALNAGNSPRSLSQQTYALLERSLELCKLTGGTLDITAYPAVRAWGFTTGENRVPSPEELTALAENIDYTAVTLDPAAATVALPAGMELDLGAVAKGWAGEELARQLRAAGVTSAALSLGGNVQTIGTKPDGSLWRIGIQDPHSETGAYLASVSVADMAVVTSGGYQRFFEQDGVTYWHILDPETAAPSRSGVSSATIVGRSGSLCDAFSTALFIMGGEQAAQFWLDNPQLEFDYVLIFEDGSIHITAGLEDSFQLVDGYRDRKVTVIAP